MVKNECYTAESPFHVLSEKPWVWGVTPHVAPSVAPTTSRWGLKRGFSLAGHRTTAPRPDVVGATEGAT